MSVYSTREDIFTKDGKLLLRKNHEVNEDILPKLKKFNNSILIDTKHFEIYNGKGFIDNKSFQDAYTAQIIQSFSARKHHNFNERILIKPNKVLNKIIFGSKHEPWWLYINALANHVDWLYTHSIDVALMSLIMAAESGYNKRQLFYLGLGSLFHDMGMLLLPKSILEKHEKFSKAEELIHSQHCELGVSSFESFNLPTDCTDIILQHHERLDGSGYPKGLKEDEICLNSKIVMIADAIDTMTSARPDKQSTYQLDEAIRIIKNERKFDKELICHLEKILR